MNQNPSEKGQNSEVTEENLVAYLDGELSGEEASKIATQLSLDPNLRAKAEALQRAYDLLDFLPRSEPSPDFTSRTISQVLPTNLIHSQFPQQLPQNFAGTNTSGLQFGLTSGMIPTPQPSFPIFSVLLGIIFLLCAAPLGYFLREQLYPHTTKEAKDADARMVNDIRLIKNMRLFRHVDDLEFIRKLDSVELFGEEEN